MTKGQKIILILLAIWWFAWGVLALVSGSYFGDFDLIAYLSVGIVATIPAAIIFWVINPKRKQVESK